jgi:hypothetical protein
MQSLKLLVRTILLCSAVLILSISSTKAATLDVVGGQLMGASGVNVDGESYDVAFVDGSCISLYDGCDSISDFTFSTSLADLASTALLEQVFLGDYDSDASLTNGCDTGCRVLTAWNRLDFDNAEVKWADNDFEGNSDTTGFGTVDPGWNTGTDGEHVYAVWSTTPVGAVPVPAAVWLFGTALIGLVGFGKRRKAV